MNSSGPHCTVDTLFLHLLETLFTDSLNPQIQVDMLIDRGTTEPPRPYPNGVTPPTDGPFVWSRTGTMSLNPWPQGSVVQLASGL